MDETENIDIDNDTTTTTGNPSTFLGGLGRSSGGVGTGAGGGIGGGGDAGGVSDLEQDVLDEYARLARNMKSLNSTLATLASGPLTLEIADGLRLLEQKVASVYTLMKASVYSIVLQQGQIDGEEEGGGFDAGRGGGEG